MANEQAKSIDTQSPKSGSAKLVTDLKDKVGKPDAQQAPEISQTPDPLHSLLVAEGLRTTGKLVPNSWA